MAFVSGIYNSISTSMRALYESKETARNKRKGKNKKKKQRPVGYLTEKQRLAEIRKLKETQCQV